MPRSVGNDWYLGRTVTEFLKKETLCSPYFRGFRSFIYLSVDKRGLCKLIHYGCSTIPSNSREFLKKTWLGVLDKRDDFFEKQIFLTKKS